MKKLFKILGVIVVLLLIIIVVIVTQLGNIVEKAIDTMGPELTGVPVSVDNVLFRPLAGKASVKNLVVGNPEGFKKEYAFKLDGLAVSVDMGTVMSDKIVINDILIDGPEITYELGLKGTNLGKLKKQIEERSAKEPSEESAEAPEEAPEGEPQEEPTEGAGKVVIRELVISNGKINFSPMGGTDVPIPLPTITLTDIGEDKDGVSIAEVVDLVIGEILTSVVGAVKGAGALVGDTLELGGKLAIETVDTAVKGGEEAVKAVGAGAEAAIKGGEEAVKALGEGAKLGGDAAEAAAEGLVKGADAAAETGKKLGRSASKLLGGLTGGKKEEE